MGEKLTRKILALVAELEQLMQDYAVLKDLELEILKSPTMLNMAEFKQIVLTQKLCALLAKYDPAFAEHRYKLPMMQLSLNIPLLADELAYVPFMLHSIYIVLRICIQQLKQKEQKLAALIAQVDANAGSLYVVADVGVEIYLRSLVGRENPYIKVLRYYGISPKKEFFTPDSYILTESNELYYIGIDNIRLIVDRGLDAMRPLVAPRAKLCLTDNDEDTVKLRETKKISLTPQQMHELEYQISRDPVGNVWLAERRQKDLLLDDAYSRVIQLEPKISKFIAIQNVTNKDIKAVKMANVVAVTEVAVAQEAVFTPAVDTRETGLRKLLEVAGIGSQVNKEQAAACLLYSAKPIFSKHKVNKKLKYHR